MHISHKRKKSHCVIIKLEWSNNQVKQSMTEKSSNTSLQYKTNLCDKIQSAQWRIYKIQHTWPRSCIFKYQKAQKKKHPGIVCQLCSCFCTFATLLYRCHHHHY